jgi:hypothetical protein
MTSYNTNFIFSQTHELGPLEQYALNRWTGNVCLSEIHGSWLGNFFFSLVYTTDKERIWGVFNEILLQNLDQAPQESKLYRQSASHVITWMEKSFSGSVNDRIKNTYNPAIALLVDFSSGPATLPPQQSKPLLSKPTQTQPSHQKGLPNVGNTCWMNTAIKCISTSGIWDKMLENPPPPEMKRLHQQLCYIVESLRSGKEVAWDMCKQLENEIFRVRHLVRGAELVRGRQNDSAEFLLFLQNAFHFTPESKYSSQRASIYSGTGDYGRYSTLHASEPIIGVVVSGEHSLNPNMPVNLEELISGEEYRELRPSFQRKENSSIENLPDDNRTPNRVFKMSSRFTQLPDIMLVNLNRYTLLPSQVFGNERKRHNQIKLGPDGTIHFREYKLKYDNRNRIIGAEPKAIHRYRIKGSITHLGYDGMGHYVYEERNAQGKGFRHSDSRVSSISTSTLGQDGYFFILEKVDVVPIK